MDIKDKTVILTGATGGIGRELSKKFDEEGASLILISKSEEELQSLIKSLKGSNHSYFTCDLSDQAATEKLGKELAEKYKNIDVLFNAAGIGIYKTIEEETLEEFNKSMNINLFSEFIMSKSLIENLKSTPNSLVISIGSGDGVIPVGGRSIYCTTKFAVRGMMLSFAEEFRRSNPKFCLITLGSTLTGFGPLSLEDKKREMESGKGYLTPEWVAKRLVEIVKEDNREVEYEISSSDYKG
jgi:short-subunit dehydrogenase